MRVFSISASGQVRHLRPWTSTDISSRQCNTGSSSSPWHWIEECSAKSPLSENRATGHHFKVCPISGIPLLPKQALHTAVAKLHCKRDFPRAKQCQPVPSEHCEGAKLLDAIRGVRKAPREGAWKLLKLLFCTQKEEEKGGPPLRGMQRERLG